MSNLNTGVSPSSILEALDDVKYLPLQTKTIPPFSRFMPRISIDTKRSLSRCTQRWCQQFWWPCWFSPYYLEPGLTALTIASLSTSECSTSSPAYVSANHESHSWCQDGKRHIRIAVMRANSSDKGYTACHITYVLCLSGCTALMWWMRKLELFLELRNAVERLVEEIELAETCIQINKGVSCG